MILALLQVGLGIQRTDSQQTADTIRPGNGGTRVNATVHRDHPVQVYHADQSSGPYASFARLDITAGSRAANERGLITHIARRYRPSDQCADREIPFHLGILHPYMFKDGFLRVTEEGDPGGVLAGGPQVFDLIAVAIVNTPERIVRDITDR